MKRAEGGWLWARLVARWSHVGRLQALVQAVDPIEILERALRLEIEARAAPGRSGC